MWDNTSNLASVLRLPGTTNRKPDYDEPLPVCLVAADPDRRYAVHDLRERFPSRSQTTPTKAVTGGFAESRRTLAQATARSGHHYAEAVLANQVAFLARAEPGERNNALARASYIVGQYTDAGGLDPDRVEQLLIDAAVATGLEPEEAQRTFGSCYPAGRDNPRLLPEQTGCGRWPGRGRARP
jgi:hypothetical protein